MRLAKETPSCIHRAHTHLSSNKCWSACEAATSSNPYYPTEHRVAGAKTSMPGYSLVVVGKHHRVEPGVHSAHVLRTEFCKLMEACACMSVRKAAVTADGITKHVKNTICWMHPSNPQPHACILVVKSGCCWLRLSRMTTRVPA